MRRIKEDRLNETFKKHLKLLHEHLNINESKYYDAEILDNGDYKILAINNKDNPLGVKVGDIVPKGEAILKQYYSDGDYFKEIDENLNEVLEEGITDDWFKEGSFSTYKKPAVEKYEIATEDGILKTLEGEQEYKKGYYILTGPKGEKYSMPLEKFNELKDDLGNGKCSPKKIMKVAKLADHDGSVKTSWGAELEYTAGNDYIVRHGAGDYGVVKKDIFDTTYVKKD